MRASVSIPLLALLTLGGCWQDDLADLPADTVTFAPEIEGAPEGWVVTDIEVDLECPDGTDTRFYLVYPQDAADAGTPLATAVLYHSGSFDFVYAPQVDAPLEGTHYAEPDRLQGDWAIRNAFVTLGMLPDEIEAESHTGALPVALAEENIAMVIPTNCWGDWWHNRSSVVDNDFSADQFKREGRSAAEWAYQIVSQPGFALAITGEELPFAVNPAESYVIGLGEGGRAVTELLSIDQQDDGVADYQPTAAVVDSVADDLSILFADPALFGNAVAGLSRIFPDADTDAGSIATATLPERFGYLYALQDPQIPRTAHVQAMDRLVSDGAKWVHVSDSARHVLLNDDIGLARDAVAYLTTGVVGPPGDGQPVSR